MLGGRSDAADCADRLLLRFGGLAPLMSSRVAAVSRCAGIEVARIVEAARDACIALTRADLAADVRIDDTGQCVRYLRLLLAHRRQECVHVLFLDGQRSLLADEEVATGTIDRVTIHPREIIGRALELGCASIILAHNHPGGSDVPSEEDVALSWRVAAAARTMGIVLQDHVVVSSRGWTSLKAEGLI